MCFTPIISLITALFEFFVAGFILFSERKSLLNKTLASFIFFLGAYQLTEFFLCVTGNPLWAKLGFISYTFLPALGLIFTLAYLKRKSIKSAILLIPIAFSFLALTSKDFVIDSFCGTYFVSTRYFLLSQGNNFLGKFYLFYYFGIIALIIGILIANQLKEKNKTQKKINLLIIFTIIISLAPALILIVILPYFKVQFPSIYCHFAIIFAICALIGIYLQKKNKNKTPKYLLI